MIDTEHSLSTRDRVFAICNDLYRRNQKPSVRLVLSMLPDISSTSSVHKPFKEWMDEMEAQQQSLYDKLGFSEEFTQAFMREITRFGVEAEDRYKSQAADAKEQRDIAVDDLERTEDKYFKQSALVEQQAKQIRELKAELVELKRVNEAVLKEQKHAHENALTELRQRSDDLKAANESLTATNEKLRTELAKTTVQLENNERLVREVKNHGQKTDDENRSLRDERAQLTKEVARLETTLDGRQQLIDELKASAMRYESTLAEFRDEKAALKEDTTKLRQQLDDAKQQLSTAIARQSEQQQSILDLRSTIAEQSRVIERITPSS